MSEMSEIEEEVKKSEILDQDEFESSNNTLTMLKRRGVAIKFVKDETGDTDYNRTGDSENIDFEAATLANSDEKKNQIKECETTKTLSAIEKNVAVTECNARDKKLAQVEKVSAAEHNFFQNSSQDVCSPGKCFLSMREMQW